MAVGIHSDLGKNSKLLSYTHTVDRLSIDVDEPYDAFRDRYEEAVPKVERLHLDDMAKRGAKWEEVREEADALGKFGFFIYYRADVGQLFRLAGHSEKCTEYLMGNHTIAERMFRFDPSVMLYAPLRTEIYVNSDNRTRFVVDRPSSIFSSFDKPEIAKVGAELDTKLEKLLRGVDVDVGDIFKS